VRCHAPDLDAIGDHAVIGGWLSPFFERFGTISMSARIESVLSCPLIGKALPQVAVSGRSVNGFAPVLLHHFGRPPERSAAFYIH
jgi:hypothetical protein